MRLSYLVVAGGAEWVLQWDWTDWIGLVAVILAVTFMLVVPMAIVHGANPLKALQEAGAVIKAALRVKVK